MQELKIVTCNIDDNIFNHLEGSIADDTSIDMQLFREKVSDLSGIFFRELCD